MSNEKNTASNGSEQEQPDENIEYTSFSDDIDPITPSKAKKPNEDQARILALEEEISKTKDHMLRAVAEAENGRKRALKDREDASKYAVSSFSRDILSVADNLRRALDSVPSELLEQHPQIKNLTDGIEATERELLRGFTKHGIKKTEPLGEHFDPNFHEVMFETPMPDKQNGTIIQVIEAGYTINGRILRPARVGVAKNHSAPKEPPPSGTGHTIDTQA